jgi:hypothetical protein
MSASCSAAGSRSGHEPVSVVDADNYKVLTGFDAGGTHSVAADSENIHVFVPINALR